LRVTSPPEADKFLEKQKTACQAVNQCAKIAGLNRL